MAWMCPECDYYGLKPQGTTGVEPVTSRSAVECSATELYPQHECSFMHGLELFDQSCLRVNNEIKTVTSKMI